MPNCLNKFSTSYGLIVKTQNNCIILIRRKVPYCVQNFYISLHSKQIKYDFPTMHPFEEVKKDFEATYLPNLKAEDRLDYMRFKNGSIFEDFYDFPHGQIARKSHKTRVQKFLSAYREFCEESGYRFTFKKNHIPHYPLIKITFMGCDGFQYTQNYFIIENAKGLRRHTYFNSYDIPISSTPKIEKWNDDRLVYVGEIIPINSAYNILREQQKLKEDKKHLLCQTHYSTIDFESE